MKEKATRTIVLWEKVFNLEESIIHFYLLIYLSYNLLQDDFYLYLKIHSNEINKQE